MKISKWGIIGPGRIAGDFVKDLERVPGPQQVTAVLGRNKDSVHSFTKKFSVPRGYTSIDDFILAGNIDVVYIATPHPFHYESALICLANKIPVLCEKPLCINSEQCRQLILAANTTKTFMMEGMWIRFLPSIKQALALVNQGRIGELLTIQASMNYKAPVNPDNRYFNPLLGGGSLLDLGIYPVFLALLLHGVPETIRAVASLTDEGIDEACTVIFKYKDGCQAILESSLRLNAESPAEIKGTMGSLKILHPWFEKSPGLELILNDNKKINYAVQWEGHGLHYEIEETLKCISEGKVESDLLPHSFSMDIISVLDEIRAQVGVKYEMYE